MKTSEGLNWNQSFKSKMLVTFTLALAALVTLFGSQQYLNQRLLTAIEQARIIDLQIKNLSEFDHSLDEIESQLDLLLAADSWSAARSNILRHFQQGQDFIWSLTEEFVPQITEIKEQQQLMKDILTAPSGPSAVQDHERITQKFKLLKNETLETTAKATLDLRDQLNKAYLQVQAEKSRPMILGLLIVLFLLVVLIFAFQRLYGRLKRFLDNMSEFTESTPRLGLSRSLVITETDELGLVEKSFNRMVEHLNISQNQVLQSNQDLENFAAVASHDLQTPLRYISAYSDLITKDRQNLTAEQINEYSSNIQNSVKRLTQLVRNLLELSKVGRNLPAVHVLTVSQLVNPIVQECQISCPNLKVQIDYSEVAIDCVPTLMQTLFGNLISNSIKYARRVDVEIKIQVQGQGPDYEILFQDNGPGVPKKEFDHLFDLFYRRTDEINTGHGIGLALCKKIMEVQGGGIQVVDSDQGLKFRIYRRPSEPS